MVYFVKYIHWKNVDILHCVNLLADIFGLFSASGWCQLYFSGVDYRNIGINFAVVRVYRNIKT